MKRTVTNNRGRGSMLSSRPHSQPHSRLCPLILLALLLSLPTVSPAQGLNILSRTGTLGIRLDGGAQWFMGSGFANEGANTRNEIQLLGNAGLYYNISPRFRAGVDYTYSRMIREQLSGTLTSLPGGGVEGELYRDLKTHFHGVMVTGEYNLLGIGPLSLYAGTGAGCMLATGNIYTVGVKNEIMTGGTGSTIQFTGHNEGHRYAVPFIPVTLSLEVAFRPDVAVSIGGGYRLLIPGKNNLSPKGQAYAALGLRINL